VLTADLMLTPAGPRLVGFRTRFAEPEVTALLPRWEDDLYVILDAAADTALGELAPLRWSGDAVCSVVLASAGYPDAYETGYGVLGLGDVGHGALAFHNHTRDPYHKPEYLLVEKIDLSARKVSRGMGFGSWLWPSRDRGKRLDRQATRAAGDPYSQIVTSGGRVLMVVGRGRSLAEARAAAYRAAESVVFTGRTYRDDIGAADPIRSAR
jgi:phosphoribosylamine--glycine ligase